MGSFSRADLDGVVIENNIFTHLEEGFHVICFAGDLCSGSKLADLEQLHGALE